MHFYPAMDNAYWMEKAFAEALKVKGLTLPNPAVGAVLVRDDEVVGLGGTRPAGQAHAEIVALEQAGSRARGATLYVTLEPCCHFGRTPPCTSALISAGIGKVVVSHGDPNSRVAGKGLEALRQAGIAVEAGVLAERGEVFYRHFAFHIQNGRPRIILKIAQSLDGRINAAPGQSTPITGAASEMRNHALRVEADAWVIGAETLRIDNPRLTPRLAEGPAPEAWVLSRGHKPLPWDAELFRSNRQGRVHLAAPEKPASLPEHVGFFGLPSHAPSIAASVAPLMAEFIRRNYHLAVVEGGRGLWAAFLAAGIWDEIWIFTAPCFLPLGQAWTADLPPGWDKTLVFGSFTSLGDDSLTVFLRKSPSDFPILASYPGEPKSVLPSAISFPPT